MKRRCADGRRRKVACLAIFTLTVLISICGPGATAVRAASGLSLGPGKIVDPVPKDYGGAAIEESHWNSVTLQIDATGRYSYSGTTSVSEAWEESGSRTETNSVEDTFDTRIDGAWDQQTGTFCGTFSIESRFTQNTHSAPVEDPTNGDQFIVKEGTATFAGTVSGAGHPGDASVRLTFSGSDHRVAREDYDEGRVDDVDTTHDWAQIVDFPVTGTWPTTTSAPCAAAVTVPGSGDAPGQTGGDGTQQDAASSGSSPLALVAGIVVVLAILGGIVFVGVRAAGSDSASEGPEEEEGGDEDEEERDTILLSFTYPAGRSPKIFTTGWLFGAKAIANPGTPEEEDISDSVEWSGTGSFSPSVGAASRPSFEGEGTNTITITVEHLGKVATRDLVVDAVSSAGYAHVGSRALSPADSHHCPVCPHEVEGVVLSGSSTVMVNGRPAARRGDPGRHSGTIDVGRMEQEDSEMSIKNILEDRFYLDPANYERGKGHSTTICCGENTFTISGGDPSVLIDGRPAARIGDETRHCGGVGHIEPD